MKIAAVKGVAGDFLRQQFADCADLTTLRVRQVVKALMFAMSVCVIIAHPIGYLTIVAMITRGVIRRLSDCHSIGQHEALEAVMSLPKRQS